MVARAIFTRRRGSGQDVPRILVFGYKLVQRPELIIVEVTNFTAPIPRAKNAAHVRSRLIVNLPLT